VFFPEQVASQAGPELASLSEEVLSDQVFKWVSDAERNEPFLKGQGRDAFGRFTGELVVTEGWRKLQEMGVKHG
jgi:hypothetical protein